MKPISCLVSLLFLLSVTGCACLFSKRRGQNDPSPVQIQNQTGEHLQFVWESVEWSWTIDMPPMIARVVHPPKESSRGSAWMETVYMVKVLRKDGSVHSSHASRDTQSILFSSSDYDSFDFVGCKRLYRFVIGPDHVAPVLTPKELKRINAIRLTSPDGSE